MEEQTQHQVMTEIALALAMVFFCVMVLALVSVGVEAELDQPQLMKISEQKSKPQPNQAAEGVWVIWYEGQFYNHQLEKIDPTTLTEGPIWLAVPSNLNLQQLLSAKQRIFSPDVSIALLDQRWLTRLEELP